MNTGTIQTKKQGIQPDSPEFARDNSAEHRHGVLFGGILR
jgi:hypothetical protein